MEGYVEFMDASTVDVTLTGEEIRNMLGLLNELSQHPAFDYESAGGKLVVNLCQSLLLGLAEIDERWADSGISESSL